MLYGVPAPAQENAQPGAAKSPAPLGTIKSISGNTLILTSDAGGDVSVEVRDSTKIVRIAPGQTDLKDAQTIALTDLQVGDRILIRGKADEVSKTFLAASIIAMKKADIAVKQSRERDEWQKSGVGGLVNSVDASGGAISVTVPSLREKKNVAVHISQQTVLRRYAPGSVRFDDAKPAPLAEIRPGDQLRARGEKNADGSELTALEVVSGSFRNISGTISTLDTAQGTITVHDLATKKPVTVKITADSQLRKLPAAFAQRIAQRLNGSNAGANADQAPESGAVASAAPIAKDPAPGAGRVPAAASEGRPREAGGRGRGMGPGGGGPGGGQGGAMDLQQMLSRMPASTIADLQKGDAVMLVGTEANGKEVTAITLLAGVEPILQGSPNGGASSILSPWSLSGAPSGEAGTP
jgi:transcription antitermination factor NusG